MVQKSGHTYEKPGSGYARAWPVDGPMPTQTTEVHHALACPPFMLSQYDYSGGDGRRVRSVDQPLPTVVANGNHDALVVPLRNGNSPRSTDEPLPTMCTGGQQALATLPFIAELRGGHSDASGVSEPLATVCASGNHHGLVTPPAFYLKNYGDGSDPSMMHKVTDPLGTVTGTDHHSLVRLPFTVDYHGNGRAQPVDQPLPTQDTRDRHALVDPGVAVEDCGFRMLEPHEIGKAMAFPSTYEVLGNKRQRVRQYGNAVTPPVMSMILERCIASLSGDQR